MSAALLSVEIGMLGRELSKGKVGIGTAVKRLQVMAKLAQAMELELESHRLIEANQAGRQFLEGEAGKMLKPQPEVTGNIIRPDFGGRK